FDLAALDRHIRALHREIIILIRFRDARAAEVIARRQLLLELGIADDVEIGAVFLLHRRALRPGLQAPRIALDDEIPELALLLLILPGEAQLHPLPPARLRVLADMDPL